MRRTKIDPGAPGISKEGRKYEMPAMPHGSPRALGAFAPPISPAAAVESPPSPPPPRGGPTKAIIERHRLGDLEDQTKSGDLRRSDQRGLIRDLKLAREWLRGLGRCVGCGAEMVLCPHCSGGDDCSDAGSAQGGYSLCTDDSCPECETCCGC